MRGENGPSTSPPFSLLYSYPLFAAVNLPRFSNFDTFALASTLLPHVLALSSLDREILAENITRSSAERKGCANIVETRSEKMIERKRNRTRGSRRVKTREDVGKEGARKKFDIHWAPPPTFPQPWMVGPGTSGFKPLWKSYCDSSVTISRYIRRHFRRLTPFPRSSSAIASRRPPLSFGLCLIKYYCLLKKLGTHTFRVHLPLSV